MPAPRGGRAAVAAPTLLWQPPRPRRHALSGVWRFRGAPGAVRPPGRWAGGCGLDHTGCPLSPLLASARGTGHTACSVCSSAQCPAVSLPPAPPGFSVQLGLVRGCSSRCSSRVPLTSDSVSAGPASFASQLPCASQQGRVPAGRLLLVPETGVFPQAPLASLPPSRMYFGDSLLTRLKQLCSDRPRPGQGRWGAGRKGGEAQQGRPRPQCRPCPCPRPPPPSLPAAGRWHQHSPWSEAN